MKIKDIELADISRFRSELMGAAILFIILFHVALPRSDMFFGLRRMGNVGVDMFFFLSGVGLWFSWVKTPQAVYFYKRRLLRIFPAWLIMSTLFYLPDYLGPQKFSSCLADLIGDITINLDFWLHDELTFWYIPATMMLYLWAPLYMKLIKSHPIYRWLPVVMIMWCISVQYVTPLHNAVGHLEIFWSRVPIFFIGINMGEAVRRKQTIDGCSIWMILLMFGMALAAGIYLEQVKHGRFPLFLERMLYIPLTITSILLINCLLRHTSQWTNRIFAFLGTLSLEIYLIHSHFVLKHIEKLGLTYWLTFISCVLVTVPLAWVLHTVTNKTEKRLHR